MSTVQKSCLGKLNGIYKGYLCPSAMLSDNSYQQCFYILPKMIKPESFAGIQDDP